MKRVRPEVMFQNSGSGISVRMTIPGDMLFFLARGIEIRFPPKFGRSLNPWAEVVAPKDFSGQGNTA